MPNKTEVQAVLDKYDSSLGSYLYLFKENRSIFMEEVAKWLKQDKSLELLKKIIHLGYCAYLRKGNFQIGKSLIGIDETMKALFEIDAQIFDAQLFIQLITKEGKGFLQEYVTSSVWRNDAPWTCTLAKKGLWHLIPENILSRLDKKIFSIRESFGNTPIMWAIANGNMKEASFLAGYIPQSALAIADISRKTPLIFMVIKGSQYQCSLRDRMSYNGFDDGRIKDVFDAMMARSDLDVDMLNYQDKLGNTALHLAYLRRDKHMVEKLIEKGAGEFITNHIGLTPYQFYLSMTAKEAFQFLSGERMLRSKDLLSPVPDIELENRLDQRYEVTTVSV